MIRIPTYRAWRYSSSPSQLSPSSAATSASTEAARRRRPQTSACCCPTASRRSAGRRRIVRASAAAFKALGDSYSIVNAEGSASTQLNQAQQCLTNGAKVILLVNLDSGSGAAIEKLASSRRARRSIDYDRLTLKGAASYYVSFDNVKVGQLQGQGLDQLPEGERRDQASKPVDRRAERRADRQQRDAVRAGLQRRPQPALQERDVQEGPEPVGAAVGQPEGADDLPGHADQDEQQDPGGRSRPTTASATRRSRRSSRPASSRSRSPARTRRRRGSRTSSPAGSA